SFKVPLYLRTANSYDGKGSHRIFIPYFQLLIQITNFKEKRPIGVNILRFTLSLQYGSYQID
uniref:hypothetical protein n=1 Tax=Alistipes shahii TaxID=328814 RepID=UPI003FF0F194